MIQEIPTAGIILAAGASTRFGQPKQLLRLKDKYLVEWVLDAALSAKLHQIILVLGADHREIKQALGKKCRHPKLHLEINPHPEKGQSSSLQRGLSSVADTFPAAMFLLADQPLVDAATLDILLQRFWAARKYICVPTFAGRKGNPCILSKYFYPHIMKITGDIGARQLIQANPKHVLEVDIDNPHFFLDVDTPQDLAKIKTLIP